MKLRIENRHTPIFLSIDPAEENYFGSKII
jgi:hypothetical protein